MKQTITSITAQKRPGRFNIFLDSKYAFSVAENVLVRMRLYKGRELTGEDLEEIFREDDLEKAVGLALDYLSYSLRTEREVRNRLAREEMEDDVIDAVISRLAGMNLINDREYAGSYVRTMAKTSDKGPRIIADKLREKGVSRCDIEDALTEYTDEMQLDNALKLAEKTATRNRRLSFRQLEGKITQTLIGKGFSQDTASRVREELDLTEDESEEHDKLLLQARKLWRKNSRLDSRTRRNKVKAALFRKGFDISDCDMILDELENQGV